MSWTEEKKIIKNKLIYFQLQMVLGAALLIFAKGFLRSQSYGRGTELSFGIRLGRAGICA